MRSLLALLLVVLLAGVAQGNHGAPHPTELTLVVPDLMVDQEATLAATLRNESAADVANEEIIFEVQTTFGWLELGRADTNSRGRAAMLYTPSGPGTFVFRARFNGTAELAASEDEATVAVGEVSPPASFPTTILVAIIVATILGGIWGTYGFVVLTLRQIWIEGGGTPFLNKRKEVRTK